MFSCRLCETETVITTNLCNKCRRVKHLINLYEDRVYEVLEDVLVRQDKGITNKCKKKLEEEKENVVNKIESAK